MDGVLSWHNLATQSHTGKDNVGQDTLTRDLCASATSTSNKLSEIHDYLCHPGVTRLLHFVGTKNLPHSTDHVKRLCASCKVCSELKPQFYRAETGTLIKATQPMERLSIDVKDPLKSTSRNTYMFTVVDEYSRFHLQIYVQTCCLRQSSNVSINSSHWVVPQATSTLTVEHHFFPRRSNIILHKKSPPANQHHTTQSEMANVNGTTVSSGMEFNSH